MGQATGRRELATSGRRNLRWIADARGTVEAVLAYALTLWLAWRVVMRLYGTWGGSQVPQIVRLPGLQLKAVLAAIGFVGASARLRAGRAPGPLDAACDATIGIGLYLSGVADVVEWFAPLTRACTAAATAVSLAHVVRGTLAISWRTLDRLVYGWLLRVSSSVVLLVLSLSLGILPLARSGSAIPRAIDPSVEEGLWSVELIRRQSWLLPGYDLRSLAHWAQAVVHVEAGELGLLDVEPTVEIGVLG